MTFLFLGIFAVSLVVSFVATRQVRDVATQRGWISIPRGGRHVHENPLPRLGGVAIFLAFSFSLVLWLGLAVIYPKLLEGLAPATLLRIYVPACLIFCLGIYDDLHGAGPYLKFSVQVIAATMLFLGGMRILDLPLLFGAHSLPWFVGLPLTVIWVVAVTNAFNLIDGLDGLLGDSGSLFIGFVLSALALAGAQKAPTLVAVAIPVVSFGLPILETTLSILRRLISGRPIFTADREHIHHKLLASGMSHRQVVIVLYAVSALFAMLSLFLLWPTGSTLGLVLAVVGTGVWLGVQHLNYLEFGELRRVALRTMEQRQIVINNLSVRRAVEELKVAADLNQVRNILLAAFEGNDFDAFELHLKSLSGDELGIADHSKPFHWTKFPHVVSISSMPSWKLTLELVTTSNRRRGSLVVYRVYTQRGLQLDVNLVTSEFPVALADALDRVLVTPDMLAAATQRDVQYLAANL